MARCSRYGGAHIDGKVTCPRCKTVYPDLYVWAAAECLPESSLGAQVREIAGKIGEATAADKPEEIEQYSTRLRNLRAAHLSEFQESYELKA